MAIGYSARFSEYGWTERWRESEKESRRTKRTPSLYHAESGVEQKDMAGWTRQQTAEQNAFPLPESLDPAFVHHQILVKFGRTFPVSAILIVPT